MKMKTRTRFKQWFILLVVSTLVVLLLAACTPYGSISIGVPFNVGPVYVNPRIGVGAFL